MSENTCPFPTYKGKPLVRCGDTIYYGDMGDPYVTKIQIKTKKKVGDLEVADKVNIQLIATNPDLPPSKIIEKNTDRQGLYTAIEMADIWLERKLSDKPND